MIPRPSRPSWSSSFGTDPVASRILLKSPIAYLSVLGTLT
jgi:hypothetical protein